MENFIFCAVRAGQKYHQLSMTVVLTKIVNNVSLKTLKTAKLGVSVDRYITALKVQTKLCKDEIILINYYHLKFEP